MYFHSCYNERDGSEKMNDEKLIPNWLTWARLIQSIAQTGLHYAVSDYDADRYLRLQQVAANMVAFAAELDPTDVIENFQLGEGYATPKVDLRGAVLNGQGELLMVREKLDGGWTLPGGWADVGDVPSEGAEREVWEESGYEVKARRLVGVYDANRSGELVFSHAYKLIFLCDLLGGEAAPSSETTEVGWFAQDSIPQPFSGERTRQRHIDDIFDAFRDPAAAAVFD
jgi:ADP-ribose pyrophosphatase YjhB (NUDIX family)